MEHLPVFRAPREGDGRMHQFSDEGRMHQFPDAKKSHGKGTDTLTDTLTDGHRDSMKKLTKIGGQKLNVTQNKSNTVKRQSSEAGWQEGPRTSGD